MTAHSRFGGSIASRYMNCPGSVALLETVPPKPSSSYAAEGTFAHTLAEYALNQKWRDAVALVDGHPYLDEEGGRLGVTSEMVDAIQVYLDAVWEEVDASPDAQLFVEHRFNLLDEEFPGEVFGTNDAMVYSAARKRLALFDYKHGVGVSVSAEDNPQLQFYAAGALFSKPDWRVSDLELMIVQPRARDADKIGAVRRWTIDIDTLLEFTAELEAAIKAAKGIHFGPNRDPKSTLGLSAGSWCRWCDAAAVCPAREAEILQTAQLDFADVTEIAAEALPDPKTFDTARLGHILKAGKLLNDWLNQVQDYVEALVLGGTPVEGWKAVEKIGRAKWQAADEDVASYLEMMFDVPGDLVRPRKLTTIGDVEKLMKAAGATKDDIDTFKLTYTIKESSGRTIAPSSDRRPAVDALVSDFGGLELITKD